MSQPQQTNTSNNGKQNQTAVSNVMPSQNFTTDPSAVRMPSYPVHAAPPNFPGAVNQSWPTSAYPTARLGTGATKGNANGIESTANTTAPSQQYIPYQASNNPVPGTMTPSLPVPFQKSPNDKNNGRSGPSQ